MCVIIIFFSARAWSQDDIINLLKQIISENPFQYKKGSIARGKSWETIGNSLVNSRAKVIATSRVVREKYELLKSKFISRMNMEARGSGIVAEFGEFERLMQDLIDMEKDSISILEDISEKQKIKEKTL